MILDYPFYFARGQSVSNTSAITTNVCDVGSRPPFNAYGKQYKLCAYVVSNAGGGNVTVDLYNHSTTTVNSGTKIASTGTLTTPAAGTLIEVFIPKTTATLQYWGGYITTTVGAAVVNVYIAEAQQENLLA